MKILYSFTFLLLIAATAYGQISTNLVPTDTVAVQIAKAVWLPVYGTKILRDTPFVASLLGDTLWVVKGSLPPVQKLKDGSIRVTYGGVPYAEIMKNDGRILSVYHTK